MYHAIGTEHDVPADTDVRYDPAIVPYNRFWSNPAMRADRDIGADPSGAIDYRGRVDAFVDMHGQLKKVSQPGERDPQGVQVRVDVADQADAHRRPPALGGV